MSRALLIFARRPHPGRVKTRLSPFLTPEEAAALYDCMVRDVVARTAALEGDVRFLYYEDDGEAEVYFRGVDEALHLLPQDGAGLGERLANAFAEIFRRGFRTAAVIGADSPDLPLSYINEAFERLESGSADIVFGPTEDGGYYLAALKAPHPELFRDVPWSTDEVLAVSLHRADGAGLRPALLPCWYDVDEPADLARPGLQDKENGACRTRKFLKVFTSPLTADTHSPPALR
jgi:rSAM/selenodomain-associated transferase 1